MSYDWNKLRSEGYCIVSRKYGMISRIDRYDWKEEMAKKHAPWDINEGLKWVNNLDKFKHAEDHYRRCHSKDVIEVGESMAREAIKRLPQSGFHTTGYVEKLI